jgi:hypothetical protein
MFGVIHGLASRPFIGLVLVAMGVSLTACSRSRIAPTPIIPGDWKRIELSRYSVSVPPDIGNQTFEGEDSEIWHAENGTMKLACDYGAYSTDLQPYANQPEYRAEWFRVGGKEAKIETLRMSDGVAHWDRKDRTYVASAYFPAVLNDASAYLPAVLMGRTKLTCRAYSADSTAQQTAKTILLSIRFR